MQNSLKMKVVDNRVVTLEYADCPDDGGKYALICSIHSGIIQDSNKARLWGNVDDVKDWCCNQEGAN